MRAKRAKDLRKARARDVEWLMRATNENAAKAEFYRELWVGARWEVFWANVEMAAVLAYTERYLFEVDEGRTPWKDSIEKAIHFWPCEVKI